MFIHILIGCAGHRVHFIDERSADFQRDATSVSIVSAEIVEHPDTIDKISIAIGLRRNGLIKDKRLVVARRHIAVAIVRCGSRRSREGNWKGASVSYVKRDKLVGVGGTTE